MPDRSPVLWAVRAAWLALPAACAPVLADALGERSPAVAAVLETLLWTGWAAGLVAVLVPRTTGLVVLRTVAPAATVAAVWAGLHADEPLWAAVAIGTATVAALLSLAPEVGARFVNGSAYGDERRHLLRPPAALLVGPLPLAWAVVVAGTATGPLLLAAEQWVAGAVAVAAGWPLAALVWRSLHALASRWVVLVPAGLVVKDHLALVDPVLFRRRDVELLAPAEAGTEALDLTAGAPGLVLELRLREAVPIVRVVPRRREGEPGKVRRLLVVPTRPGALLVEAERRRIPTG